MTGPNASPSARTILALGVALGLGGAVALSSLYAPRGVAAAIAALMMGSCFAVVACCVLDISGREENDARLSIMRTVSDAVVAATSDAVVRGLYAPHESRSQEPTGRRGHEVHEDHERRVFTCHPEDKCEGEGCPIHHPSNHPMRNMPWFVVNRPLITRLCDHGYQHPDPDSLAYVLRFVDPQNAYQWEVHECCPQGCCGQRRRTTGDHPSVDGPADEEPAGVPAVVRESLATAADTARALARPAPPVVVPLHQT